MIVEAMNADQTNGIAEGIGIYFNGCDDGRDCDCCGDRWYAASGEGDDEPMLYGSPVAEFLHFNNSRKVKDKEALVRVFYLDGVIQSYFPN